LIHQFGVHHPETTLVPRFADFLPGNKVVLSFISLTFPEEPVPMLVKASMSAISQHKPPHGM
jgi:hypothetical protein